MSEHTKEPWKVFTSEDGEKLLGVGSAETAEGITDYRGGIWAWDDEEGIANARRIVACVNALAGIDDPEAWVAKAKEAINGGRRGYCGLTRGATE